MQIGYKNIHLSMHPSPTSATHLLTRLFRPSTAILCCCESTTTLPSTSAHSQSQLAREIRKRFETREYNKKKPTSSSSHHHSSEHHLLAQVESIAAQRFLLSDPDRFAKIEEATTRNVISAKVADVEQLNKLHSSQPIVLPFDVEANPGMFTSADGLSSGKNSSEAIVAADSNDVDRGFFILDNKFCDDYSAATTADLPEEDMTEPPLEYFGNLSDAVEHIEFQQPGQTTQPKMKNAPQTSSRNNSTTASLDVGEWASNYGTTEMPEKEGLSGDGNMGGKLLLTVNDAKCAGCGAQFHCQNPSLPGFVPLEMLRQIEANAKKIPFYQKTDFTCRRCYLLNEYNFLLNLNVSKVDYAQMMSKLKLVQETLVLLLVDMTDLPGSINRELPRIIGAAKPMIVIGNKVDLLPPDARSGYLHHYHNCLRQAVADAGISSAFNVLKHCLISARTGFGVEDLITNIYQNWIGPRGVLRSNIYVVGATNAGKSTLFNTFIQSDLCKVRAIDLVERVTTSIWPGTTLSLLKFPLMNPTPQKLELRRRRLLSMQAWHKKEEALRRSFYRKTADPKYVVLQGIVENTYKEREENLQPVSTSTLIRQFNGELTPAEQMEAVEKEEGKNSEETENIKTNKPRMSLNDNAFLKGNWCYDTPGSVNGEQILDLFTLEELINVIPRSIVMPRIFILFPGQSLLVGAVARLDLLAASSRRQRTMPVFMTVFASKDLKINVLDSKLVGEFLWKNRGDPALGAPIGDEERLKKFPKLKAVDFRVENRDKLSQMKDGCGVADVVLSSLGWTLMTTEASDVQIRAWTPGARGLSLRQPPLLPWAANYRGNKIVGTAGYNLRPLAQMEEIFNDEQGEERRNRKKSQQQIVENRYKERKNIEVDTAQGLSAGFVNFDLA